MVIITRSKSSGLLMSITAEVREYFDNLIKPLITNKSLEKLLYKFKEGIISKFEDKLREQSLKSIIKDNPSVMCAFADINCSIALKLNDDKFHYFNSEDELNKVLQKC